MHITHVIWLKLVPGIVGLLLVQAAVAGVDSSVGATYRSYPLSGGLEPTIGYGWVAYGTEGSPFSGYLRAALDGFTAGSYNSGVAKLEVFPLAFIGARAGGESIQNDKDYRSYQCTSVGCKGRYYRTFVESELSLGYGGAFAQGTWRRERWTQAKGQTSDYIDPTSGLVMSATGESQTVYSAVVGYKFNPSWALLGGVRYAEDDDGMAQMPFGMIRWISGKLTLGVGGGSFKSELKKREATALAYFTWNIWPSVAIK